MFCNRGVGLIESDKIYRKANAMRMGVPIVCFIRHAQSVGAQHIHAAFQIIQRVARGKGRG